MSRPPIESINEAIASATTSMPLLNMDESDSRSRRSALRRLRSSSSTDTAKSTVEKSTKENSIKMKSAKETSTKKKPTKEKPIVKKVIPRLDYKKLLDSYYEHVSTGVTKSPLPLMDTFKLLNDTRDSLSNQPTLVDVESDIHVIGDVYGHCNDLVNIFITLGAPPSKRYLFLGNYGDGGKMSLQTILLLLAYKVHCPTHVYLLRGTHEYARNRKLGLYEECIKAYGKGSGKCVWLRLQLYVFDLMPIFGLVDNKILCVHGGLSWEMTDIQQLRALPKSKPCKTGLIHDALWSSPDLTGKGWTPAGSSYTFGEDVVRIMADRLGVDLIVRGDQMCLDGYAFFANQRMVTLFSAPNYDGKKNAGGVMHIAADLEVFFHLFCPWNEGGKEHTHLLTQSARTSDTPSTSNHDEDLPANTPIWKGLKY